MACSSCGKDAMLVFSGLVEGTLCNDCYNKYLRSSKMDAIKKTSKAVYETATNLGMMKEFTKELMDIHKRYLVKPIPRLFEANANKTNVNCLFEMRYRGSESTILLTFKRDETQVYLQETITYPRKDGISLKVSRIYPGGRVVREETKRVDCKELYHESKKMKPYIRVVTASNDTYIISSETGNFLKGRICCGWSWDIRQYGNSQNFRVAAVVDSRNGKPKFQSLTDFVKYLDSGLNYKVRNETMKYKNGHAKYSLAVFDHGSFLFWSGDHGKIMSVSFTDNGDF